MSRTRIWISLGYCFLALAVFAWAQNRKPGLWELTTTQTWQQSPFPPNMPGMAAAMGTHTTPVCLSQQQIDKYGAIVQQTRGCEITNIVKTANGMTADLACTGRISGKGTVESSAIDADHAKGKIHFNGSLQVGQDNKPMEWTTDMTSVFKSADCGAVKPIPVPEK